MMEAVPYLQEAPSAASVIQRIRDELTNAIHAMILKQAYDTDVQLSFGTVHINSRGSVSQISFNGTNVTDMDAFIVQQALNIGKNNYFDIRHIIKENSEKFHYYPIQIGKKIFLTVLKNSPYFEEKYGAAIYSDKAMVQYASKFLIFYRNKKAKPDVYYTGLFDASSTANTLLDKAGKLLGGKTSIYYCFMNSRPEMFLHLGQTKSDFAAYHPEKNAKMYNFYWGSIIAGFFKLNKKTDNNGKIKVRDTERICLKLIIKMQFGNIDKFCEMYDIDKFLMTAYLSGTKADVRYNNGNKLTPSRLEELLNLPFNVNAEELKNKNLLIEVNYDDIPSQ